MTIRKSGYEFRPNAGTPERLFFQRIVIYPNDTEQRYHIHLTHIGNPEYSKDLGFRDYLRTHPEDLIRYAEIKRKASVRSDNDKDKYMKIQEPVIQEIIAKVAQRN